ncbi:MAG TPA: fluoride efflux transporter CrcB [Bacteroidales bacterium]|nr:fluoride efflux transporter CrcB [Bacteroidales bacterium]
MKQLLLVGFGGFLGSIARYWVSKLNISWNFYSIPMGTLTANVLGSLLIGFLIGIFIHNNEATANLKLFWIVGFCGGFTTFSSFTNENFQLIQNGQITTALAYMAGSILIGILAVAGGLFLAKWIA